jgi:uncharacterized membrane protein
MKQKKGQGGRTITRRHPLVTLPIIVIVVAMAIVVVVFVFVVAVVVAALSLVAVVMVVVVVRGGVEAEGAVPTNQTMSRDIWRKSFTVSSIFKINT